MGHLRGQAGYAILLIVGLHGSAQSLRPDASTRPIRVPGWVMAKYLTREVHPVLGKEVNELVTYDVTISPEGNVIAVKQPISRAEPLHPEVIAAIQECKYRPYRVRGVAVNVQTLVTIEIRDGTGWPQSTHKPEPLSSFP